MDLLSEKSIKIMRKTMDSLSEKRRNLIPPSGPLVCRELGNFTLNQAIGELMGDSVG